LVVRKERKMNDGKSAFSGGVFIDGGTGFARFTPKAEAAIHLHVPRSGNLKIDAMIRESRKVGFMEKAMEGIAAKVYNTGEYKSPHVWGDIADEARLMADAMLAEWGKDENS
jgi:hypothetical protein